MPECCKSCKRANKEKCTAFKECVRWHKWFHREWTDIRIMFQEIKKAEEREGAKPTHRQEEQSPKCCEKCRTKAKDDCPQFRKCPAWLSWYHKKWSKIHRPKEE